MPPVHRFRALALSVLGATALVAVPLTQMAEASPSGTYERSVQRHTDAQRAKRDMIDLKRSVCIDRFAERHARKMAAEQRMYHQDLGPILKTCKLSMVGENVAYGYPSGRAAVNAWMDSPGHRANILTKGYRRDGVGAAKGKDGRWYVAQVLGRVA